MTKPDSKMRVCVLWVFFSVAFAAARNSGCYTPAGEYGTCIPVKSCTVGIIHLDNGAPGFDKQLQCGHDDDGPLICCGSTGRVESTTQKPDVTVIPTRRSPALAAAGTLQRSTIPLNRNPYCITPNGENGTCIPLPSCAPIVNSRNNNTEFIRKSNCGNDKQTPLVCCGSLGQSAERATLPPRSPVAPTIPTEPPLLNLKENAPCSTPNGENGTCISIRSCSSLLQSLNKTKPDTEFAQKSQCGWFADKPLVCCKSEKTARPSINSNNINLQLNSQCTTPNNEEGICKPYYSCKSIIEPVMRREQGAGAFARKSQCGIENEPLVCCSDKPPNQVKLSSSAILLSQNESCFTPNREKGNCIPVNSCTPIKKAIKYFDAESIKFAQASQCGYENGPMVCCGSLGMYSDPPTSTSQVLPLLNSQSTSRRTETVHMELNSRNDGRIIPPVDSDVSSSPAFGVKVGGLTLSQVPAHSPINSQHNNGQNKNVPYSNRVSPVDADVSSSPVIGVRLDAPTLQQVPARSPINAQNNNGRNKNVPYSNRVSPVDSDATSSPVIGVRLDDPTLQQVPARSSISSQNNNGQNQNVPYFNRVSSVDSDGYSSPVIGVRHARPTLQQVPARSPIHAQNNNGRIKNVPYSNRVSGNHRQQQTDEFEPVKTDVEESNGPSFKNHVYPSQGNTYFSCLFCY